MLSPWDTDFQTWLLAWEDLAQHFKVRPSRATRRTFWAIFLSALGGDCSTFAMQICSSRTVAMPTVRGHWEAARPATPHVSASYLGPVSCLFCVMPPGRLCHVEWPWTHVGLSLTPPVQCGAACATYIWKILRKGKGARTSQHFAAWLFSWFIRKKKARLLGKGPGGRGGARPRCRCPRR